MKLLPQSAAYRIAVASAACFALATLLIGATVLYAVHTSFVRQMDETIRQASVSLRGEYADDGHDGLSEAIDIRERSAANGLGFAVFAPDGRRIAGTLDVAMPDAGWSRISFNDPVEGPDPARALATDLADGSRLVVSADLEPVENMDETILIVFSLGFAGALVLGGLLAFLLGRYLRGRLDRIAKGSLAFAAGDYLGRADVTARGDEFDQLAISLNAMLDRIEALLANLRQVTSDLAHDLRTPLSQLRGQLEILLASPEADRTDHAETAIEKCDEILRLFGAILRISELEGARLHDHFRMIDLGELAREIVEAHEPVAAESGHDLRLVQAGEPAVIMGDRELLAQALVNLVENALHHTPAGCAILVGAELGDGEVRLVVSDSGPGIAAADRERAVERFVRLDAARSTPGHGLGLSLVNAIAHAHDGRVILEDGSPGLIVKMVFAGAKA